MKKQVMVVLVLLFCAVLLTGCRTEPQLPEPPEKEQIAAAETEEKKAPEVSEEETPAPAPETVPEDQPVQDEAPASEQTENLPYTIRLSGLISIFDQPTYDGCYVQSVGEDGVYTIVEEEPDEEGNLWGKLKSGIGWIDLTALGADVPVLAGLMDERVLEQPHHIAIVDDSEYMEYLVFRATETLTDVRLTMLMLSESGYTEDSTLHTIPEMTLEKPLVAEVVFYGDFTTYGLTFTDESGTERYFALYISGRNGAPVLQEFEP